MMDGVAATDGMDRMLRHILGGSVVTEAERILLLGEAAPLSRHFVLGQPCDGSKDCGVEHG